MWILILILFLLIAAIFTYLRIAGGGSFPWIPFYTKGKESGFTLREINLLRRVAIETKIENPSALFWSIKQLDRSIKEIILKLRARNLEEDEESSFLLTKLFELRKKVEFDLPRYKLGLKSSREIVQRQRVKVTMPGAGPFVSMVIENQPRYIAFAYPQGPDLPEGFSWKGQQIGVHFWRAEDAGYFLRTRVLDDFHHKRYPIIHVAHSDDLTRTQQRRSIRIPMNNAATAYPLKSIDEANEMVEDSRGLRCKLKDISEDGAAIMVGGRTRAGIPLKIQFDLSGKAVVMCGVVKGATYDAQKNVSILHIQAVPPSIHARNHLLTYIYNLFGEQEKLKA